MAIIQISKIQQRSGNLVDLPQLSEAEFGWASDEKRLFIGKETPSYLSKTGNQTQLDIPKSRPRQAAEKEIINTAPSHSEEREATKVCVRGMESSDKHTCMEMLHEAL